MLDMPFSRPLIAFAPQPEKLGDPNESGAGAGNTSTENPSGAAFAGLGLLKGMLASENATNTVRQYLRFVRVLCCIQPPMIQVLFQGSLSSGGGERASLQVVFSGHAFIAPFVLKVNTQFCESCLNLRWPRLLVAPASEELALQYPNRNGEGLVFQIFIRREGLLSHVRSLPQ